jgi:S-adenosylmethionine decarboxylase
MGDRAEILSELSSGAATEAVGRHAGTHVLVDFWDAHHLDDLAHADNALRAAATAAHATLLHLHLHRFASSGGISGVAVLAESHISIHTWPERGYAALDIFMCGECDPLAAVAALEKAFSPDRTVVKTHLRGIP